MATVTGMTAERMLAIEGASVVDGDVVGDNLILTKHDGTQINAGNVRGNPGPQGPVGSDLVVLDKIAVSDVGIINQIRAGRQLTAADFTNMGLSAPIGLWNLSDLSDVSGNGHNLLNKGAVPFDVGINGTAATAARFLGTGGQSLYIPDSGAADSFRIKTGSVGCWFKTAKRGSYQMLVDKYGTANQQCYSLMVTDTNAVRFGACPDGSNNTYTVSGVSDVADNLWHFAVAVHDGVLSRLYVDGVLENVASIAFVLFSGSSVFNIGCRGSDAANAGSFQHLGRVDETFITADILSEDQIRNLYCAKIPHTLAAVPSRASLNVRRRKRGATLVAADFSTQPLRLYNFSGGSLGDEGSNGAVLNLQAGIVSVSGVDGSSGNAFIFPGNASLWNTDTGLPAGLSTRSYGCWFKSTSLVSSTILNIGGTALGAGDARLGVSGGNIFFTNSADAIVGPFVCDGQWHHAVVIEDNAAADGVKRRLYIDGKCVLGSAVMNAITLAGANKFRVGCAGDATQIYIGQVDSVFVCNYALAFEDILKLYVKSAQTLAPSPKNVGDHVEAMSATDILAVFDSLENNAQVDLRIAA